MGPHVGKSQRSVLEVQITPFERTVNLDSESAVYLDVLTASVLNEALIGVLVVLNHIIYILPLSKILLRNFGGLGGKPVDPRFVALKVLYSLYRLSAHILLRFR